MGIGFSIHDFIQFHVSLIITLIINILSLVLKKAVI